MKPNWVWEPVPASGRRQGGKSAERLFQGGIDSLVRESIQNSIDARQDKKGIAEIGITLIELSGDQLKDFLAAIAWEDIRDNLVAEKRKSSQMISAVEKLESDGHLLCLRIEDHKTWGLTGTEDRDEDSEKNRYCALVKDELYSDKDDSNAGGNFGLGKAVLWWFSAFSTVIFSSAPKDCPSGKTGTRFIGRASLPFHETEHDGQCSGDGWFGELRQRDDGGIYYGRYAESIWGDPATKLSADCYIPRTAEDYGLSTLIVGFDDRKKT